MDGHETFKQAVRRLARGDPRRVRRRRASRSPTSTCSSTTRPTRGSSPRSPSASSSTRRASSTRSPRSATPRPRACRSRSPRRATTGGLRRGCACCSRPPGSGFTWGATRRRMGARVSRPPDGRVRARHRRLARHRRGDRRALAADGWPVAVNYRSRRRAAARRRWRRSRRRAVARSRSQGDVSDPATAQALLDGAREALGGPVLALVNNAGVRADGLALSLTDEDWRRRARHQPRRDLPADARGAARDDPRPLRARRQHRLGRRAARERRAGQLRGVEGRP